MTLKSPKQNKLLPNRIQKLLNSMFAGDTGFSGPQILDFFSQFSYEIEPYPREGGAPTRRIMFEDCLANFDLQKQKMIIAKLLEDDLPMSHGRPNQAEVEEIRHWLGEGHTPVTSDPFSTTTLNWASVKRDWTKAAERIPSDPAGAITTARTLLESVCMHILDERSITYEKDGDLQRLYRTTARALTLSPEQQQEDIFRQVLGGCLSLINGLAGMRNTFSDAHGASLVDSEAQIRHARLAVNAAGTVALFLIETHLAKDR